MAFSASSPSFSDRAARAVHTFIARRDPRLIVAFVSVCGLAAWLLPWQVLLLAAVPAAVIAFTAMKELHDGRAALLSYGVFVLAWTASQLFLYLFQHPGQFAAATAQSLFLGGRLFALLGLALAVPLGATPLMLGRTLAWYLSWLVGTERWICGVLLRGKVRPVVAGGVWRASLALCLMMAFFPRSIRAMKELRRSMLMRAPHLPLHKRMALMGLALLRVVSAQTWDMALAIASRDVYRPGPWIWQEQAVRTG